MPKDFSIAAERAQNRIGEHLWAAMSLRQQKIEIYVELRALDTARTILDSTRKSATSDSSGPSQ
jgi:hypothetical protein